MFCLKALFCDQGGSEGTHDAGDIRTDGAAAGDPLKTSQYGVVVEGSALDNNVFSERFWICQFNNF